MYVPFVYSDMSVDRPGLSQLVSNEEWGYLGHIAVIVRSWVCAVSFWAAIALPWILLGVTGAGYTAEYPTEFAMLLIAAIGFAIIGRHHRRSE